LSYDPLFWKPLVFEQTKFVWKSYPFGSATVLLRSTGTNEVCWAASRYSYGVPEVPKELWNALRSAAPRKFLRKFEKWDSSLYYHVDRAHPVIFPSRAKVRVRIRLKRRSRLTERDRLLWIHRPWIRVLFCCCFIFVE